ncbi:MAG: hypothetical protein IKM24_07125 [Clostridia bacterium]|nr:hypothetical protein [Clostridia bacterium]
MYKVSVPVSSAHAKRADRERLLQELKRMDAERVFLSLGCYETNAEKRDAALAELADNCRFFKNHGYEVGAWIWTFWIQAESNFRDMRTVKGKDITGHKCPTDPAFVAFACDYIQRIVQTGVDLLMFDDDFRYGFQADAAACLCDGHITAINAITGENSSREELENYITTGGKNKYRDAFLQVNGDAIRSFASSVRKAVDVLDENMRVGFCACMSSWDLDGTDAYEIACILAGKTKPFVRLIGAPYWAALNGWGNLLQDVIELERMECAWTRKGNIEIFSEGDAYPRPRCCTPASYVEGFDTALRAAGCMDGILKYGLDYTSNADYETGYALFHERNRSLYADIDRYFANKTSVGVRVYESMQKIADAITPTAVNDRIDIENIFFSKAARSLAYCSVPTVYEGSGVCGIVFDENARNLPLAALEKGLILDIAAAEILMQRGIDVGIRKIGQMHRDMGEEHILKDDNYIHANGVITYELALDEKATVLSDTKIADGIIPVSFCYENAAGNRFLVLNFNTRFGSDRLLKHYAASRRYADAIAYLSGKKLPAFVYGNPALYVQAKEGNGALAVGLWNFFADIAVAPIVELDKTYSEITFINCTGKLEKDRVHLSDIPAFGFAGFEVK